MTPRTIGAIAQDPAEFAYWLNQSLSGITVLGGVAQARALDHLGDKARTAAEIAADAGLDPPTLTRLLDYLASQEVLLRDEGGRFSHTPFSRTLRSDHPGNLQATLHISSATMRTGSAMGAALDSGATAQTIAHGMGYFAQLKAEPELADAFARFMSATTAHTEGFVFAHHTFLPFSLAVDVGGNHGSLLLRLLAEYPGTRGIVFDLPEVVALAQPSVANHAQGHRVELAGGSFFEAVPVGGDLYLLKQILHDWDDPSCVAILRTVRAAIAPHGRLAIIDHLMPESPTPHAAYFMDLFMLMLLGGKERRLSEFEALFAQSGFRLDRVTQDPSVPCVIEASPV